MTKKAKAVCLTWIPVILLPVSNSLLAICSGAGCDAGIMLPSVIGAAAEELFFRWFLLKVLLFPRIKPRIAIFLVSIFFAAMHLFNLRSGQALGLTLTQMLCAFAFSVWAGAVVWRNRSILIPLLAHVLINLTASDGSGALIPLAVNVAVLIDGIVFMQPEFDI